MVAYNVHSDLARMVIDGRKCSVLKGNGARAHARQGDILHIDTGNVPPDFSKSARYARLMEVPCSLSVAIRIEAGRLLRDGVVDTQGHRMELMAKAEGFATFADLRANLERTESLPWNGRLLRWNPIEATMRAGWPLIYRAEQEGNGL